MIRTAATAALLALAAATSPLAAQDAGALRLHLTVEEGAHVGRRAPSIVLPYATRDSAGPAGQPFDLAKELGHTVVLVFHAGVTAPGAEADWRAIAAHDSALAMPGTVVAGISADSIGALVRFAERLQLPFKLLDDNGRSVARQYGAMRGGAFRPLAVIVGRDGYVRYTDDRFAPRDAAAWVHLEAALRAAREQR